MRDWAGAGSSARSLCRGVARFGVLGGYIAWAIPQAFALQLLSLLLWRVIFSMDRSNSRVCD